MVRYFTLLIFLLISISSFGQSQIKISKLSGLKNARTAGPPPIQIERDGEKVVFELRETEVMPEALARKYPEIKSYRAVRDHEVLAVTRYEGKLTGFYSSDNHNLSFEETREGSFSVKESEVELQCIEHSEKRKFENSGVGESIFETLQTELFNSFIAWPTTGYGDELLIYDLALAWQGKYSEELGLTTKAAVMANLVNLVNGLNIPYERDLGLRLRLIPNNDTLIFLDTTDPYPDFANYVDAQNFLGINQVVIDSMIGSANYDIGHIICRCSIGRGSTASPCNPEKKASGGSSNSLGLFKHEIGHQFNGQHGYHLDRSPELSAFETGVVGNNNQYFYGFNLERMHSFIRTGNGYTCPDKISSGNTPPSVAVSAADGKSIPVNTPYFLLNETAFDVDASADLTYTWENNDGGVFDHPDNTPENKLMFTRPTPSSEGELLYIPGLTNVVNGTTDTRSVLSAVPRDINLKFVVRDNQTPTGAVNLVDEVVHVVDNGGPFEVILPNALTPGVAGEGLAIEWNVSGTDLAPINATVVDIILSTDGGQTWPDTLLKSTPNDGSETVILPAGSTTNNARILVRASDNIFYNVGPESFEIFPPGTIDFDLSFSKKHYHTCEDSISVDIDIIEIGNWADPINLTVIEAPAGSSHNFPVTVSAGESVSLKLNGLSNSGIYPVIIEANSNATTRRDTFLIGVAGTPLNGGGNNGQMNTTSILFPDLTWQPTEFTFESLVNFAEWANFRPSIGSGYGKFLIEGRANGFLAGISLAGGSFATQFQMNPDQWYHLAVIYRDKNFKLLIDGELRAELPSTDLPLPWEKGFFLGADLYYARLSGFMDETRLWSRALSVEELRTYMHLPRTKEDVCSNGLEIYFQFEEASGGGMPPDIANKHRQVIKGNPYTVVPNFAPLSSGIATTKNVETNGLVSFDGAMGDTDLDIDFGVSPNGPVVVTKLDGTPRGELPTVERGSENYWIVHNYGTVSTGLNAQLTFKDNTLVNSSIASNYFYHRRPSMSYTTWDNPVPANAVSLSNKTLAFNSIGGFSQFWLSALNSAYCSSCGQVTVIKNP